MTGVVAAQVKPSEPDPRSGIMSLPGSESKTATLDNHGDQKKERKPRRERLPLPDPIPEKFVTLYAEPIKSELQLRINAEDEKLQQCFDRLSASRSFYDSRQNIRESGKPALNQARAIFLELNDDCRRLFEERKILSTKLKTIKEEDVAARAATTLVSNYIPGVNKDGNEALRGVRTIQDLRERIATLQYRQETESLNITDDKKIVQQISFLHHKGRDFIISRDASLRSGKAIRQVCLATRNELEDARRTLDKDVDIAKEKLEAQRKVVDDIRIGQEKQIKDLEEACPKIDRDCEKKKIGTIKSLIRKMRNDFQIQVDNWYLNQRIFFEQQKIAKRKKYESQQAEREARRKAWEEEQAYYPEPHPYQVETDMCSGLTIYLQTLLGETISKPLVNLLPSGNGPSLKSSPNTREIATRGKSIGKSSMEGSEGFENLTFNKFVKKGGKAKNKKGRGRSSPITNGNSVLSEGNPLKPHSIDYLTAFTSLDIKPPTKLGEVRMVLDAVKAKAAYYETAPAPSGEEKARTAKGKVQSPKLDLKSSTIRVDLSNADCISTAFPGLAADSVIRIPSRKPNLPSFMAVAKGVASVPSPLCPGSVVSMPEIGMNAKVLTRDSLSVKITEEKFPEMGDNSAVVFLDKSTT